MKAIAIRGYGGVEQVELVDLPEPEPGPDEVVVRLRAAALNHLDLWTLSGTLALTIQFPFTLGADGAGEVVATAASVRGVKVGANVLINPGISCRECEQCRAGEESRCVNFRLLGRHVPGTFAQFVRVPSTNVWPIPEHLSMAQAAALGVTFGTAYRNLFTVGRLMAGESLLITGIGGGLALSLFQLGRPIAEKLFVTSSSSKKLDRAAALGADAGINYKDEDVAAAVRALTDGRGVDLIVDAAGGDTIDTSLQCLRPGGRLVISGATAGAEGRFNLRRLFGQHFHIIGSTMASDRDFSEMLRELTARRIEPVIDRTFPLAEAADALAYLESQSQFGKVVLEI
ncbi:MAG: zinc-binding dehydrogenase [Actinomycetota bacterium]